MPKRWLQSADVLIDDQGRLSVALPEELLSDGRLKVDASGITVSADVIDIDVDALIDGIAGDKTLADLHGLLLSGGDPVLPIMSDQLCNGLLESDGYTPLLRSIGDQLQATLFVDDGQGNDVPALSSLLSDEGYSSAYFLHQIEALLRDEAAGANYLSDVIGPAVENIYSAVTDPLEGYGIGEILSDVWDPAQHALRLVAVTPS
jgi:hypothetical protein